MNEQHPEWRIDDRGNVLAQSGVTVARLRPDGTLMLWDKRAKEEKPFTPRDWCLLIEVLKKHLT